MSRRRAIVAYDISDPANYRRVLRTVKEWRLDGQESVHECLLTRSEAQELFTQLCECIDQRTDRLLLAWLNTQRPSEARRGGRAFVPQSLVRIG